MSETIEVIFKGDDKISGVAKGIGKSFATLGKSMAAGLAIGTAALGTATAGTLALGAKLVTLGSDAAETSSLIENSLGEATNKYTQELKQFANDANRSFFELQQGTSTIIAMTKSMGASNNMAADFGVTFGKAAANLGSFFNQADSQVLLDIQSAISGSSETMQKYGIDVKEGTLKQMALNQGMIETGETLTSLQRTQLIQQAIMEQASDAMGDAIRTSGGWANQLRGLKATITDAATEAGTKLLPVLTPLLTKIGELAKNIVPKLQSAFDNVLPKIEGIATAISNFIQRFQNGSPIFGNFIGLFSQLGTAVGINGNIVSGFTQFLNRLNNDIFPSLVSMFNDNVLPVFISFKDAMAPVVEWAGMVVSSLDELVKYFGAVVTDGDYMNDWLTHLPAPLKDIAFNIGKVIAKIQEFMIPIVDWIRNNIELEDVLGALAVVIGVNVVSAIASAVIAFAPFIAVGVALVGVVKLIRDNWDTIQPVAVALKDAVTGLIDAFKSGAEPVAALSDFVKEVAVAFGATEEQAEGLRLKTIQVIEKVIEIKDKIVEFMTPIIEWIKNNVTLNDVLTALAIVLGGVVIAAVVAIAQAIGPVILVVTALIAGVTLLRKGWEALQPTIKKVSDFFTNKVFPVFQRLKDNYLTGLALGFKGIRDAVQSVLDVVEKLTLGLVDINIPPVLMPGSPTPFEMGLRGISDAMQGLYRQDLPALNSNLQGVQQTSNRTTTVNQTQNIYTSGFNPQRESRAALEFAIGGI